MNEPIIPTEFWNPAFLFADPRTGSTHPFYLALGVLFAVLLLGGVLGYFFAPRLLKRHWLRIRLFRRLVGSLAAIGGLGLFWVLCRAGGLPLFARPLWLWFTLIALFAVLGYAAYYWRRRFPKEVRAYDEKRRLQRWIRPPRKRATARHR